MHVSFQLQSGELQPKVHSSVLNGAERGVKRGAPEELLRTSMSLNFAAKIGALWPRENLSPIPIIRPPSGFPTELVKLQGIQMLH